ncbi:MAG: transposase [Candidatus Thorarchaeota archaeon]
MIIKFFDNLLSIGFELRYVIMDREFYRAALLDEIKRRRGNVLIPAKSYKTIKKIIEQHLKRTGN